LSVIAHVENAFGIFACEGGIYRLAEALEKRARELGVELHTQARVDEIIVERDRVRGVRVDGRIENADTIVANCDVAHLYERLLPNPKLAAKYRDEELSLSAYVLLAVTEPCPLPLLHHNVFFS